MTWAEPYAYGIMGLDEEQFERISSTRVFELMLRGAIRRQQLLEDLIGHLRVAVFVAGGVKLAGGAASEPPEDHPTFLRIMGRDPVGYGDLPSKTEEQIEADEEQRLAQQAALAAAQLQLYEATMRRNRPEMIEGGQEPKP